MLQPKPSSVRCMAAARKLYGLRRQEGMAKEPRFRPNFIREWRKHRHLSLEQLAARCNWRDLETELASSPPVWGVRGAG